jgi:single-strand DNA-binding protein
MGMFSLNQALIAGNVTKDPELTYTQSGQPLLKMSVATEHSVKKNEQWENIATFHNVTVWGKLAEMISKKVSKGTAVTVTGRIENRSYEKQDGSKGYSSGIIADTVLVQNVRTAKTEDGFSTEGSAPQAPPQQAPAQEEINIDDIPF